MATAQASVVYSGDLGAAGVVTADAPQVLSQNFSIEGVDQFFLLAQTTSGKGGTGTTTNFYVSPCRSEPRFLGAQRLALRHVARA